MKNLLLITLIMFCCAEFIFAQTKTITNNQTYPKHLIKTNLIKDINGKINADYEHVLTDYTSINARLSSNVKVPLKGQLTDYNYNATAFNWELGINGAPKLFTLGTQVEYRLYSKKRSGPRGFYGAPYINYSFNRFSLNANYKGNLYGSRRDANADLNAGLSKIGGGFLIGAQWLIKNKVSIDWNFLGLGYNWYIGSLKLISDDLKNDLPRMKNDLESDNNFYTKPVRKNNLTVKGNTLTLKGVSSLIAFKSNLSIGFAF